VYKRFQWEKGVHWEWVYDQQVCPLQLQLLLPQTQCSTCMPYPRLQHSIRTRIKFSLKKLVFSLAKTRLSLGYYIIYMCFELNLNRGISKINSTRSNLKLCYLNFTVKIVFGHISGFQFRFLHHVGRWGTPQVRRVNLLSKL
jgi:hypothetical protein